MYTCTCSVGSTYMYLKEKQSRTYMIVFKNRLIRLIIAVDFNQAVVSGNDEVKDAVVCDVVVVHTQHPATLFAVGQLPLVQRRISAKHNAWGFLSLSPVIKKGGKCTCLWRPSRSFHLKYRTRFRLRFHLKIHSDFAQHVKDWSYSSRSYCNCRIQGYMQWRVNS